MQTHKPITRQQSTISRYTGIVLVVLATPLLAGADLLFPPKDDQNTQPWNLLDTEAQHASNDLAGYTLEQLMGIQVTSVAGVKQEWFKTPAALYVITAEDIRRTGHRSLAEALRLVPGMTVGRIASNIWAVGSRGFDGRFANKLLVMVDGRTVYNPLFSGTFWEIQDTIMADIDRIEAIRGPGATLWGANAVNGVINVTTKSAKETQGLYLNAGGGDMHEGFAEVRYGDRLSENAWYRAWGKYHNYDALDATSGGKFHDDWDMTRGGFRIDIEGADNETMTIDADVYYTPRRGQSTTVPVVAPTPTFTTLADDGRSAGGHLLVRTEHDHGDHGWTLQGYYDRVEREGVADFEDQRDTFDIDFRQHLKVNDQHQLIWGLGYRHTKDHTEDGQTTLFSPGTRVLNTVSAFIQDTITVHPDELYMMLGAKFEDNTFTDFEAQPSARVWWTPNEVNTLWAAVSRPIRVPSRAARDLHFTVGTIDTGIAAGGPPSGVIVPITLEGDSDVSSEKLTAYEIGYRTKPTTNITLDVTAFYHDYRSLVGLPKSRTGTFDDDGEGETYGVDVSMTWQVASNWRLDASYNHLRVQVHGDTSTAQEDSSPRNQAKLRSALDIAQNLELNSAIYYVDSVHNHDVDSYIRVDVGVTWHIDSGVEFALWGQNLFDNKHQEFDEPFLQSEAVEIPRSVYGVITCHF